MVAFAALCLLAAVSAVNSGIVRTTSDDYFYFALENGTIIKEDLTTPVPIARSVDPKKLRFFLYTQNTASTGNQVFLGDLNSVKNAGFNANVPTKVLIHGYTNNYESVAVQGPKNAYLENYNYNVIIADYKEYNSPYLSAVSNAKQIGTDFGNFLTFLVNQAGLKVKDLHIIGHSLGAHIAAFTANAVSGDVPRITGLDPAGPVIGAFATDKRLDTSDAQYVDIIHSSATLGITYSAGHSDFWPNGGTDQPRCTDTLAQVVAGGCDHAEAVTYLIDTITKPTLYTGAKCDSDDQAKKNKCTGPITGVMGEQANTKSAKGIFYIDVRTILKL